MEYASRAGDDGEPLGQIYQIKHDRAACGLGKRIQVRCTGDRIGGSNPLPLRHHALGQAASNAEAPKPVPTIFPTQYT
jgi:hypothetical protein